MIKFFWCVCIKILTNIIKQFHQIEYLLFSHTFSINIILNTKPFQILIIIFFFYFHSHFIFTQKLQQETTCFHFLYFLIIILYIHIYRKNLLFLLKIIFVTLHFCRYSISHQYSIFYLCLQVNRSKVVIHISFY